MDNSSYSSVFGVPFSNQVTNQDLTHMSKKAESGKKLNR